MRSHGGLQCSSSDASLLQHRFRGHAHSTRLERPMVCHAAVKTKGQWRQHAMRTLMVSTQLSVHSTVASPFWQQLLLAGIGPLVAALVGSFAVGVALSAW